MRLSFNQTHKWFDTDDFCDCASDQARDAGDPIQWPRLDYETRQSQHIYVHGTYVKAPPDATLKTSVGLQLQRASVGLSCSVQLHAVAIRQEGALRPWFSYGGSLVFLV